MTDYTTTEVVNAARSTYQLAAADTLSVTDGDAIIWEGTDTNITVTIEGTITNVAKNSFAISGGTPPTGHLDFNVSSGGIVNAEFDARDLGAGASITINNAGLFNGSADHAIRFGEDGGVVTLNNNKTGVITTDNAGEDVLKDGSNAIINNRGKIISAADELKVDGTPLKTGGNAVDFGEDGINNQVHNFAGAIIAASHHGITGELGAATIINDAGGQVIGHNGSGINFDNDTDPAHLVTVKNSGVIMGESQTYDDSDGDAIDCDGSVNVENHGFIGGMGAAGQHDGGDNHAEAIAIGGGTVKNFADGTIFSVQRAFQVDDSMEGGAPAALILTNAGIIQASNGWEAIKIVGDNNDKITNSGVIIGDVIMGGGDDTVTLKAGSSIKGEIQLGDGNDTLTAVEGKLNIDAGAGSDIVKGGSAADTINGSAGTDTISGRGGADKLTGGANADTFVFALGDTGNTTKTADTILDFSIAQKDMLDLSAIDANSVKNKDQAFTFIGSAEFHDKAGELRFEQVKGDTYVYGDLDGNGKSDFMIHLDGSVALKAGSFDL
jgi:hypothetical protein